MTEMRDCSTEDGRVFARNNGTQVTLAGREAILLHNMWVDQSTGEHHQVGLDLRSDPRTARETATFECQRLVPQYFEDVINELVQDREVTPEYIDALPEIYRDILGVFPDLVRRSGDCLALQTLYSILNEMFPDRYGLREIRIACEQLADGGAIVIRHGIFACPTKLGEEIIAKLTGEVATEKVEVPPFSPPPAVQSAP